MAERGESESPVPSESASQSHSSSASDSAASREGKGPAPPPPPRANPGAQQNANSGTVTQTSAAAAVSKKAAHSETGQPSSREGRTKAEKGKASAAGATGGPSTSAPHNRKRKETTEGAIAKSASSCSNLPTKSLSRNHNHLGRHGDTSNRARRNASRERTRHREEPPEHQVNVTLPNLSVTVQEPPTSTDSAKQKTPTKAPTNQNLAANGPAKLVQPVTTPSNIPNLSASVPAAATNQNAGHSAPTNQSSSVASNHGNQASGRSALRLSPNLDTSSSGSASESPPVRPKQPHPISSPQNQSSPTKPTKASNLAEEPWEGAASLASIGPPDPIPHNWQSTKGTVKERLTFMFNNEVLADVHFLVGRPPHRIPGHRFVLSVGSAVFDAMFNGAIAEEEEVELPDVEPAAFLALLRFLYSDEVHIGPETVMTTLYTAKKYAVPALERSCVDFLKRNLSADNAFMLLSQARLFDEPQLAALCLETIDRNTGEALAAEGFTDIDLDTLCVFLGRDTLGIRECKLFSALCRWADSECERRGLPLNPTSHRRVLDPALPSLRFPLMSVEEFALGPAQSGILSDREVVELFLYFTVSPKPNVRFSDTPRCCLTGKEQFVARFCQIESRWGYSGTSDRIRFTVNRRVFVVGFGLYGGIHGPADYSVNIQIIHTDTGKLCGVNDTTFSCDGSTSISRVMFKEPVEVAANVSYTACATLKGPDSYYGTKGLRKVTHESLASGKVTFQFTYAAGNNNGTSVEDGQIPEIIFYT